VVRIVSAAPLSGQGAALSYVLYDPETRAGTGTLRYGLYCYADRGLPSARAVRLFGHRITDGSALEDGQAGTPLTVGSGPNDVRSFTWRVGDLGAKGSPGAADLPPGEYYLYLVADDGIHQPSLAVSDSAIRIEPTPAAAPGSQGHLAYLH
jgi:hypothetical protein